MKSRISGIVLLGVATLASRAQASNVTINFDDLAPGCTAINTSPCASPRGSQVIIVNNQYLAADGVTFSASSTYVVLVESGTGYNTSSTPNVITTGNATGTVLGSPTINLIVTFTNPVFNLTFDAYGNDTTPQGNIFAQADVYENGSGTPAQTGINLIAANGAAFNGVQPDHLDFSAFQGITQLVIRNDTDTNGTAYDNFNFTTNSSDPSTVPEPSTLLLTGLCGIVWAGRRFLAHKNI
jgi:hypothetical protein